jgi:hypothetical protein
LCAKASWRLISPSVIPSAKSPTRHGEPRWQTPAGTPQCAVFLFRWAWNANLLLVVTVTILERHSTLFARYLKGDLRLIACCGFIQGGNQVEMQACCGESSHCVFIFIIIVYCNWVHPVAVVLPQYIQ